jgi:hypothetical protein
VASVRRCIDCDVVLVDEAVGDDAEAPAPSTASPLGAGDQVGYELEGWGNQLKVTLEGMLDKAGIRRVWEAGALVVPAEFEEQVDLLVATVEGGEAVELPEDVPQIAFEIEALSREEIDDLDARLIAGHIAHAWEDTGALLVAEEDEEAVAEIIEQVLAGEDDEEDGLATQEALSAVYVAVDKLGKDPFDAKLRTRYVAAAEALDGLGVPYGLSGDDWRSLLDQVADLRDEFAPDAEDEDDDEDGGDEDGDERAEATPDVEDDHDLEDDEDAEDDEGDEDAEGDGEGDAEQVGEALRERVRALRARLVELV